MPLRLTRLAFIPVLAAMPLVAVVAEDFVTAKGKTVAMPEIGTLTCPEIEKALADIDATRYRENAPVNPDPADDPLFVYEQALAHALFQVCVVERRSGVEDGMSLKQQVSNR